MSTSSTWITPGHWTALAGTTIWVLADGTGAHPSVRDLWSAVSASDATADQILALFLANGLPDLGGFAIAAVNEDEMRVIVRHPATVDLQFGEQCETIEPIAAITWIDTTRPRPSQVLLASAGTTRSANDLPLALGASSADALYVEFSGPSVPLGEHDRADPGRAGAELASADMSVLDEPVPSEPTPSAIPSKPEADPVHVGNPYLGLLTSSTNDRDALLARLNEPDEAADPSTALETLADTATAQWPSQPEDAPEPTAEAPSSKTGAPASGGLIDGVPGMGVIPIEPVAIETPSMYAPGQAFGRAPDEASTQTVSRGQLEQLLGATGPVGPTVMAVRCGRGHLTNPMLPQCRICHDTVPEQTPVHVARPSLGVLRMPNGDTVPLDKSIVLGRAPEATPGVDEHLVTVTTSGEISRMHARITLDNWNVVIRDLDTTNGTFLTLPGQPMVQLRGGEDYLVEPGAEIDLADTLTLRFEAR